MRFEFIKSAYNDELRELFKKHPSVQNVNFHKAYKPGLDRMLEFDKALGFPSKKIRSVHIAGTNGKGSVANMLAACFSGGGIKTGLYTSPHLVDFRERMRIGNHLVGEKYVYDFIMQWKSVFEELSLSFFEITTGMAFKWFADMGVDAAIIETGLGGRLDSTNIIVPELSIVTSIGLDHCEYLGHTLSEIACEKAGIFKQGVPALIGQTLPETAPVFIEKAASTGSKLIFADKIKPCLWDRKNHILDNMDLQGSYQQFNLRTTLAAIDILKVSFPVLADSSVVENSITHTASIMDFHGRWEKLSQEPLVIADIGHNAAALKNNFAQLQGMLKNGKSDKLIIVYAVMADKNLDEIIPLMPEDADYIFTTPVTSRALPASEICRKVTSFRKNKGLDSSSIYVVENVSDAVREALELAVRYRAGGLSAPLIYIGGSTFVVAEAIPYFKKI